MRKVVNCIITQRSPGGKESSKVTQKAAKKSCIKRNPISKLCVTKTGGVVGAEPNVVEAPHQFFFL